MRREWEEAHAVIEEIVEGPPSRRANATLTACPTGNYLWCIGGEFFSEDGKAVSSFMLLNDYFELIVLVFLQRCLPLHSGEGLTWEHIERNNS